MLLLLGLGLGVITAAIAILPAVLSPGGEIPWRSLPLTLAGVLSAQQPKPAKPMQIEKVKDGLYVIRGPFNPCAPNGCGGAYGDDGLLHEAGDVAVRVTPEGLILVDDKFQNNVSEILEHAVPDESPRERLRRRLRAEGRLTEIPVPDNPPSRDEVIAMLRGDAGRAFLEALEEDRKKR